MRRITLLSIIIALVVCSGCSASSSLIKEKELHAYIGCIKNDGKESEIETKSSIMYTVSYYEDSSVEKEKTIEYRGKEYDVEYKRSNDIFYSKYIIDRYESDDVSVGLYRDGTFRSIYFKQVRGKDYVYVDIDETKQRQLVEEYIDEADEYVDSKIDLSLYEKSGEYVKFGGIKYYYKRYVCGIETCESICVTLSEEGELIAYSEDNIGMFDSISDKDIENSKLFTDEAYDKAVEQLKLMYDDDGMIFEKDSETLCCTRDGKLCNQVIYSVRKESVLENGDVTSELYGLERVCVIEE